MFFKQLTGKSYERIVVVFLLVWTVLAISGCQTVPKNVVLFIGDGMGPEQVKAASIYDTGGTGGLVFARFKYKTEMTTYSADAEVTDSAAAATAMATGVKVNNGVVSVALPGDGTDIKTMLEYFKEQQKGTGLVTTTYITHATPACFAAHVPGRGQLEDIAKDYFQQSQPNVLFGAGEHGVTEEMAVKAGYVVVRDSEELQKLDTKNVVMVSGQFGSDIPYESDGVSDLPSLSEMTAVALRVLDNNKRGFFLMVEGGKIDWAGHKNNLVRNIGETIEFAGAVEEVLEWLGGRNDTLIVIAADHETGGLKVLKNNGKGKLPEVSWDTTGHTATRVPVYAHGPGAEAFTGPMDNTNIFHKIMSAVDAKQAQTTR